MDDQDLIKHISELVEEEHHLEAHPPGGELSESDQQRLRALEVQLDQCWDLLRQRRARRETGQDPDRASSRPASTVEGYKQ